MIYVYVCILNIVYEGTVHIEFTSLGLTLFSSKSDCIFPSHSAFMSSNFALASSFTYKHNIINTNIDDML